MPAARPVVDHNVLEHDSVGLAPGRRVGGAADGREAVGASRRTGLGAGLTAYGQPRRHHQRCDEAHRLRLSVEKHVAYCRVRREVRKL